VAQAEFLRFLTALASDPARLAHYDGLSLPRLLFHAKNEGFGFTAEDAASVVGRMEAGVIIGKDCERFDGSSSLWRQMWGKRYLGYLVTHVLTRYTDEELSSLVASAEPAATAAAASNGEAP
jgi:hypothetical protein